MSRPLPIPLGVECAASATLDTAFYIHRILGPGLPESVYEFALAHELRRRGTKVQRQVAIPVVYDGIQLDCGLRIDLLIDDQLIVEIKAAEAMIPLFEAQLMTYLKLSRKQLGLLINFNIPLLKDGIRRIVSRCGTLNLVPRCR
jgi:GxxExxY protein